MSDLTTQLYIKHDFTTAYFRISSGTTDRVGKDVTRIARLIFFERDLSYGQSPAIINVIQRVIKRSTVERLGKAKFENPRYSLEVFLWLTTPQVAAPLKPLHGYKRLKMINRNRCCQIVETKRSISLRINFVRMSLTVFKTHAHKHRKLATSEPAWCRIRVVEAII